MIDAYHQAEPLIGYKPAKPMVFAGIYPTDTEDYPLLRDALEKLQLNDASLTFEPETARRWALVFGWAFWACSTWRSSRSGWSANMTWMSLVTAPSVEYEAVLTTGEVVRLDRPSDMPDPSKLDEMREPWMKIQIYTPKEYIGPIMELVTKRRGESINMEYLDTNRVMLTYRMPLAEMIVDFYDKLKSATKGYASLDYQFEGYRAGDLVKMDILVNGEPLDRMSMIVHRDHAQHKGAAIDQSA